MASKRRIVKKRGGLQKRGRKEEESFKKIARISDLKWQATVQEREREREK